MQLVSKFQAAHSVRSASPLSDDQIRTVAPSIYAEQAHKSRSARYAYIPTIDVLNGLRKEGFQPFMAAQTKCRDEGKKEHTKHLLRLRHATQISAAQANEIILINSHDGSSAYQMLAGVYRLICSNGLVAWNTAGDIRLRHQGRIVDEVIEGAFTVLENFKLVDESREGMQAQTLNDGEAKAFAHAALQLRYDTDKAPAPITENALLQPRRFEDRPSDMWTIFNRVQENMLSGGLQARTAAGARTRTREVKGIDQNIRLNRALWTLAEEMRKIKATP